MDIVIAGAHGAIARLLTPRLVADGHRVRGIIRNPDHGPDLQRDGAEAVICDLEAADGTAVGAAVAGADAIVFAAGAGPGSGAERKWTVDQGAAKKLIDAAAELGIRRYVMVSSIGADAPPPGDEVFSVYLQAKAAADADLVAAGLDHTIIRPVHLTDDNGAGTVEVGTSVERGEVSRDDVAAVIATVIGDARTHGHTFELTGGDRPIAEVPEVIGNLPRDGA
ncbi:MAG: NAD-dependent dehydratase [Ilumatobacteraceae bacterium]|nr:NAD-dependent dehydratase [Ilumatobacteraceae bacterium]